MYVELWFYGLFKFFVSIDSCIVVVSSLLGAKKSVLMQGLLEPIVFMTLYEKLYGKRMFFLICPREMKLLYPPCLTHWVQPPILYDKNLLVLIFSHGLHVHVHYWKTSFKSTVTKKRKKFITVNCHVLSDEKVR